MTNPNLVSKPQEPIVLDQPWQIQLYRLHVLKHYCAARARGFYLGSSRRSLKSLRREFPWLTATKWDQAAKQFQEFINRVEGERQVPGSDPRPPAEGS